MLPKIPYIMEKNRSMTIPVGNLNLSSNFRPGDIADSYGISARRYPQLTNSKGDAQLTEHSNVVAMTVFDGEIVTIREETVRVSRSVPRPDRPIRQKKANLYVGYKRVHSMPVSGTRHLATINSKIVVFPDKIYLEKIDGEWTVCELEAEMMASDAIITTDNIQFRDVSSIEIQGKHGEFKADTKSFSPKQYTLDSPRLCLRANQISYGEYVTAGFSTYMVLSGTDILGVETHRDVQELHVFVSGTVDLSSILKNTKAALKYNEYIWETPLLNVERINHTDYGDDIYRLRFDDVGGQNGQNVSSIALMWDGDNSITAFKDDASKCWIQAKDFITGEETDLSASGGSQFVSENEAFFEIDNYIGQYNRWYYDVSISYIAWNEDPFANIEIGNVVSFRGAATNTGTYTVVNKDDDSDTLYFNEDIVDETIYGAVKIYKMAEVGDALSVFKVGDAVTLSCPGSEYDGVSFVISKIGSASIHTSANIFTTEETLDKVTITRKIPSLDFICEKDNRLYGVNNSEKTIYVSALGDPTNMYAYEGVSTDSFAVAVGGEGDFTGCCKYAESVLFFKEDKIYKLVGSYPAEFALYSYDVDGLDIGSEKSPAVINEVLYYKGKNGVFAYTGGIPSLISDNFGEKVFSNAVGGSDGVCYYLAVNDEKGTNKLLSFNTRLGLWVLETAGGDEIIDFAKTSTGLHYATSDGEVYKLHGSENVAENWMVQFVPFYETIEGKKTYSRLLMRAELPEGSYMIIEVRSDDGPWCEAGKIVGVNKGIIPIRLPIARCDKFEIRLRGKGEFVLHEILREYHVGSEV